MAFSATRAAFEGFRVIGRRPVSIIMWAVVYGLVAAAAIALACYLVGSSFIGEILRHQDDPTWMHNYHVDTPEEALTLFAPMFQALGVMLPLLLILACVQICAVFRTVLRPQDRGFAYMKLGGDELRQFGLMIITVLFFGIIYCAFIFGLIFLLKGAPLEHGMAIFAAILSGVAFVCFYLFLLVRLSLAPAMTFAQKRIRFFGSWGLTKGHFWSLVGMYLLSIIFVLVTVFVVKMVATMVGGALGFSVDALFVGDHLNFDFEHISPEAIFQTVGYGGLAFFGIHMLAKAMQLALAYAPQAAAYRDLTEDRNPPAPEPVAAPPPVEHGPPADSHGRGHGHDDGHGGSTDSHGAEAAALAAGAAIAAGAAAFAVEAQGHAEAHGDGHGHADPHGDSHGDAHGAHTPQEVAHAEPHADPHGDHGHGDAHAAPAADHGHGDAHAAPAADHGHGDAHAAPAADHGHGDAHAAPASDHGHGDAHAAPAADHGHGDAHAAPAADHGHGDVHAAPAADHGHGDAHGEAAHAEPHADPHAEAHPAAPHDDAHPASPAGDGHGHDAHGH